MVITPGYAIVIVIVIVTGTYATHTQKKEYSNPCWLQSRSDWFSGFSRQKNAHLMLIIVIVNAIDIIPFVYSLPMYICVCVCVYFQSPFWPLRRWFRPSLILPPCLPALVLLLILGMAMFICMFSGSSCCTPLATYVIRLRLRYAALCHYVIGF